MSHTEPPTSPHYVFTPAELDDLLRGTCRLASDYWRRGWDSEGAATRAASETLDRLEGDGRAVDSRLNETPAEMLSRVCLMSQGDPTWDLSERDIAALRFAVERLAELRNVTAHMFDLLGNPDVCPVDSPEQWKAEVLLNAGAELALVRGLEDMRHA